MQFDIITIFPRIFSSYFSESMIKRAQRKKKIKIVVHNLRKYAVNKHGTVDDRPYGGGPGMILRIEPVYRCLKSIKRKRNSKAILFSPQGRVFNQRMAAKLLKLSQIILVCGHYEGIDERVKKLVDEEISIGKYILTGGEIPAMVVVDAVTRLIPGVLGDSNSFKDETFSKNLHYYEYPQYTRPQIFKGLKVPKILLSGDHQKIARWREKRSKIKR